MSPKTIIYIHHERALGGAPLSLLYLLQQLDRSKYQPFIICLREGPAASLFRENGFPVQIVEGTDLSHTELVWFRFWQFPKLFVRLFLSIFLFFKLRKALMHLTCESVDEVADLVPTSATSATDEIDFKTPYLPGKRLGG